MGVGRGAIVVEDSDLTRFERARVIGARSFQISMGAPPLIKTEDLDMPSWDPIKIAKAEYEKGLIPITVVREAREADKKKK